LIEVAAAIAISGFVIAAGAALLDQIGDQGARIGSAAIDAARTGNGRRLLRQLLTDAQPTLDTASRFRGDTAAIAFRARCANPRGWTEPCQVRLALDQRADSSDLIISIGIGRPIVVRAQPGVGAFRFLDLTSSDSIWSSSWTTSATLPDAIAVVAVADTLILPVGPSRE
jgi:hypothetical protein